jgi:hypothetical protein
MFNSCFARLMDAHFHLNGGINPAFTFLAPYSIEAVTKDGKSLPRIYITNQIRDMGVSGIVLIKTINGEDAVGHLAAPVVSVIVAYKNPTKSTGLRFGAGATAIVSFGKRRKQAHNGCTPTAGAI